jgi:hypothetical protein
MLLPITTLAAPCGKVLLARGEIEVISKHSSHLIRAGQSLDCGDIIVTRNGAGLIEISAGKITIGTYSRLEIADVQQKKNEAEVNALNLIYGKTRVLVQKKLKSRFEVRTPSATSGVRGTDFFVSHDPDAHISHEATVEGLVEVSKFDDTEPPIIVSGGSQTDVSIEPDQKEKPLQAERITAETRENIRQASGVAKDDPDFTHASAVKLLGQPTHWETGGLDEESELPLQRITVGIGPEWQSFLHNSSGLDGSVGSGGALTAQYEHAMKNYSGAWLVAMTFGSAKEQNDNSFGVRNEYHSLNFETGIRFDHASWWSPYVKLGVGWIRDHLTINRSDLNYFVDRDDKGMMLLGTVGIDARYSWTRSFGFFGKVEGQFGETLFTVGSSVNSFNPGATGSPDQAGANGVRGTSVTLSAIVGLMGQF